jgi:hypothetical protein
VVLRDTGLTGATSTSFTVGSGLTAADELAAKEKLDLESKAQISSLEPVRTQSIQLNYTKAEEVAKGLSGQSSGGSSAGSGGGEREEPAQGGDGQGDGVGGGHCAIEQ